MTEGTNCNSPLGAADSDEVKVTLVISRKAYEPAKAIVAENDPRNSHLGEFAGLMDAE